MNTRSKGNKAHPEKSDHPPPSQSRRGRKTAGDKDIEDAEAARTDKDTRGALKRLKDMAVPNDPPPQKLPVISESSEMSENDCITNPVPQTRPQTPPVNNGAAPSFIPKSPVEEAIGRHLVTIFVNDVKIPDALPREKNQGRLQVFKRPLGNGKQSEYYIKTVPALRELSESSPRLVLHSNRHGNKWKTHKSQPSYAMAEVTEFLKQTLYHRIGFYCRVNRGLKHEFGAGTGATPSEEAIVSGRGEMRKESTRMTRQGLSPSPFDAIWSVETEGKAEKGIQLEKDRYPGFVTYMRDKLHIEEFPEKIFTFEGTVKRYTAIKELEKIFVDSKWKVPRKAFEFKLPSDDFYYPNVIINKLMFANILGIADTTLGNDIKWVDKVRKEKKRREDTDQAAGFSKKSKAKVRIVPSKEVQLIKRKKRMERIAEEVNEEEEERSWKKVKSKDDRSRRKAALEKLAKKKKELEYEEESEDEDMEQIEINSDNVDASFDED
ncbi:hypothetical protein M422DRAFT_45570 [Sphaerobolus stellatus SS14]|uniref:Uncharacterized protein n=1 Tax=Sphaerobolus stellatus (strain SS14) TaxID=990650 RepID=A0A0C9VVU9_SPHS4|nr:hypothetical protein M422DRAFT_45570 [Sphaerobolus stellatus SS14]